MFSKHTHLCDRNYLPADYLIFKAIRTEDRKKTTVSFFHCAFRLVGISQPAYDAMRCTQQRHTNEKNSLF